MKTTIFRHTAQGTLQTTFFWFIPFIFGLSKSRITNGNFVATANTEKTSGNVFSLHVTPFIAIGFVIPSFLQ